MSEQTALVKLLIQAHYLAAENLDHPEFLKFVELEKQAKKELDDLLAESNAFFKLTERLIELRDAQQKREGAKA
jgi:hypothetical protein